MVQDASDRAHIVPNTIQKQQHTVPNTTQVKENSLPDVKDVQHETSDLYDAKATATAYLTHLKFGCKNMRSLIHMARHQVLADMPKTLVNFRMKPDTNENPLLKTFMYLVQTSMFMKNLERN